MSPFRASDEQLDREISAVQRLVRVRLRRANDDMKELEHALAELRREKRRRARGSIEATGLETSAVPEAGTISVD